MRERTVAGFGRPMVRGDSRGFWPLVMGALAIGRGIYGAVEANQQKQRNKGYLGAAYRNASAQQQIHEGDVRQGSAEGLAARGLLSPDAIPSNQSRIAAAMGAPGTRAPATSLGGRDLAETDTQLGLERSNLTNAYKQSLNENSANALNAQIGSIASGIGGVAQAAQASQTLSAMGQVAPAASGDEVPGLESLPGPQMTPNVGTDIGGPAGPSRISSAMGIDNPGNWWGGIHGLDPLGAPGSSWNTGTVTGAGQPNADFRVA